MWLCTKEATESCNIAGCEEGGRKPWDKERRWPGEAGKGKASNSPLELPERDAALPAPWF